MRRITLAAGMVQRVFSIGTFLAAAFLVFLAGCASTASPPAPSPAGSALPVPPSVTYLSMLEDAVERTRAQLPEIITSAEVAARRVASSGGRLYAAGSQPEFVGELVERPGGLACIAAVPRIVNRGDVILYAVRSRIAVGDQVKISQWRAQGIYVIAFASAQLSTDPYFRPDILIDSGPTEGMLLADETKICPTDSVVNLINAWTWMGEFAAACTRVGRMPVVLQSVGVDGGLQRGARLRGQRFHADWKSPPVPSGVLANAYLDRIAEALARVRTESSPTLAFGGAWLRQSGPQRTGLFVASHLYPHHFADPRGPGASVFGQMEELQLRQAPPAPLAVVIGYQDPPQMAIDAATMRRGRVIYTSARRDGADGRQEVLYVNPHWPMADACVTVKAYDVPILPASGVMQAAVYWALVAEARGFPPETRRGQLIATSRTPGE